MVRYQKMNNIRLDVYRQKKCEKYKIEFEAVFCYIQSMEEKKVLVIDDESNILDSIKMVLEYEKYKVKTAGTGLDGIEIFKEFKPQIVLLDVKMPGYNGIDVLRTLKELEKSVEVIMISGHSGIEEAVEASKLGAFDFLEKPVAREKLALTVRNALEKNSLVRENFRLRNINEQKYQLIGESSMMKELRKTIMKVAKTNSTVLILGESGTGKELIARNIHINSSRKDKSFVQINCAAIPEELIESELFGHEKGSFTGAFEKKIGKFDSAHNGSIFLDEIGDLSLKAQAKVLRVLEEGEIQRVGSSVIKKVDVRIIAATNKDLKEEIENGKFREDLFFRLNVVPVHSPSLNEKRDDISLLIDHFLRIFSEENNFKKREFTPGAIDLLKKHNWKGNIRELRNLVERVLIMTDSKKIREGDLPEYFVTQTAPEGLNFGDIKEWKDFKRESERFFLEKKLKEFNNNLARTAREINLPRSNLYKKIENLGIITNNNREADNGLPRSNGEESPGSAGQDSF